MIIKKFDLQGLNQAILWVKHVTEKINEHDEEIADLRNRIKILEQRLALQNNTTQPEISVKF